MLCQFLVYNTVIQLYIYSINQLIYDFKIPIESILL